LTFESQNLYFKSSETLTSRHALYNLASFDDHSRGGSDLINSAGVQMGVQLDLNRVLFFGFVLLIVLTIPIYFIVDRIFTLRETEAWLTQLSFQRTSTAESPTSLPVTKTPTPIPTETPTPTQSPSPSPSPSPTGTLSPKPEHGFVNAYVDDVNHLDDNGPQTMIKIIADRSIEGVFRAEINILWNTWRYGCFILGDENDHLYCLGRRLPETNQATVKIYESIGGVDEKMVFEEMFAVPPLNPPRNPTATRRPPSTQIPNTPTNTPTPSSTPIPSSTPLPTNTPIPTATSPPWATPPTPDS
jgi:hypothetical protein